MLTLSSLVVCMRRRAYNSLFVCVSVCKSLLYLLNGWVLEASKGLYMNKTTFSLIAISEFAQKCLAQELCQYLLTSKTVSSSPEECTMHTQRERQDPKTDSYCTMRAKA